MWKGRVPQCSSCRLHQVAMAKGTSKYLANSLGCGNLQFQTSCALSSRPMGLDSSGHLIFVSSHVTVTGSSSRDKLSLFYVAEVHGSQSSRTIIPVLQVTCSSSNGLSLPDFSAGCQVATSSNFQVSSSREGYNDGHRLVSD